MEIIFLNHHQKPVVVALLLCIKLIIFVQGDTKKWELLKNPTKIEETQEKKITDRN